MTPLPSGTPSEAELDVLFKQIVAKDVVAGGKTGASSQMPTPPHTPITPPPPILAVSETANGSVNDHSTPSSQRSVDSASATAEPRAHAAADNTLVSISTSFHPSAGHCGALPPDLVLLSADSVFFYVHSAVLGPASSNHLGGYLKPKGAKSVDKATQNESEPIDLVVLPDPSPVLNVILHIVYNISPAHHSPPFAAVAQAVDRIHNIYGIDVKSFMQGSALGISVAPAHISTFPPRQLHDSVLFSLVSSHAPIYPVEVYALAASIDYRPLAQIASTYLHGLDICPADDDTSASSAKLKLSPVLATKIGGVYLSRLVGLHRRRLDALRAAVCVPPESHLPVTTCRMEDQSALKRAWALAAAFVVYSASPDFPAQSIDSTFRPLMQHLPCILCRQTLEDRIEEVKKEWGSAPKTI